MNLRAASKRPRGASKRIKRVLEVSVSALGTSRPKLMLYSRLSFSCWYRGCSCLASHWRNVAKGLSCGNSSTTVAGTRSSYGTMHSLCGSRVAEKSVHPEEEVNHFDRAGRAIAGCVDDAFCCFLFRLARMTTTAILELWEVKSRNVIHFSCSRGRRSRNLYFPLDMVPDGGELSDAKLRRMQGPIRRSTFWETSPVFATRQRENGEETSIGNNEVRLKSTGYPREGVHGVRPAAATKTATAMTDPK